MPQTTRTPTYRRLSVAAAVVTLLVYWLVWSGLPHAVDELSALSVSESMWAGDGFSVNQMEWDQARTPPQNSAGLDGNLYSKKGLGVSLAALPLWIVGSDWIGGGAVRFALLTGTLLAAASVGLMVWAIQRLGYSDGTALLAGGVYALGTLLFAYARTLFSEAIAAPFFALALLAAFVWRAQGAQSRWLIFCAGIGVAGLLLPKSSNGIVAPFFALYIVFEAWRADHPDRPDRPDRNKLVASLGQLFYFALPVAAAGAGTILYNWLRFGTLAGFPLEPFELFNTPLLTGLAGLLISPGKGIFWYMPLALLAMVGTIWTLVKGPQVGIRRSDVLLTLASIAAVIALYALWYDWPGGRAWGPRMIAWVSPAIVLLALPLIERAATGHAPKWARVAIWVVLGASVLVQIPGALVNFEAREALDMNAGLAFDALLWRPVHSPLLTYWGGLFGGTLEPLILQSSTWRLAPFGMLLFVALVGVAIWLVYRHLRHRNRGAIWTALIVAVTAGIVLASATGGDPRWQDDSANPEDNAALIAFLDEASLPADLLVFDLERSRQVQSRAWWRQNSLPAGNSFVGWLRRTQEEILAEPEAFALLDREVSGHPRTWLVMQETPAGDPASTTESHLDALYFRGVDIWLGAQRVVVYYRWPLETEPVAQRQRIEFGGDAALLEEWSLYGDAAMGQWLILLDWTENLDADLRFSVQALDASGAIVTQVDRFPSDFSGRVGIEAPGASRIILKVYDAGTGETYPVNGLEAVTLYEVAP